MEHLNQSPTDPNFVQDPYAFYATARKSGDLFFWEEYGYPMAISSLAVNTVLRDRRLGREIPAELAQVPDPHLASFYQVEANSMLELEPPTHTRLRALIMRAFTSRRIQEMAPEISQLADACIDAFPDDEFDLLPALARDLPVVVIARLLGIPDTMAPQLLAWSNSMVAMYQARRTRQIEVAASKAAAEFSDFIREYIEVRRRKPSSDLLTTLIAAEESGQKLSTDELVSTCILILNAGHEATVHMIGNSVKTILASGMDLHALQPAFVEATVEELLRYDPPLHLFTRYVYEPVEFFGEKFKRGDKIGCLLAAANRDPAIHAEPDVFDPTRSEMSHMSFGAGMHFCLGAPLARLELQIVLPLLFARCPTLAITETPRYASLYHFHGLEKLMVRR